MNASLTRRKRSMADSRSEGKGCFAGLVGWLGVGRGGLAVCSDLLSDPGPRIAAGRTGLRAAGVQGMMSR